MIHTTTADADIFTFDSLAELAGACERNYATNAKSGNAWRGGNDAQILQAARHGDDSYVPQAEALLEQISLAMPATERRDWIAAPAGAYPVVPEALAGLPTPMRARVRVNDDRAP